MKTSLRGQDLIKEFEGLRLNAYQCSAGVWTIGYGSTSDVKFDDVVTEIQAGELLIRDLSRVENALIKHVHVPLNQNQFDALSSFTFNIGIHAFCHSTLLKKLNAGDYSDAAHELLRWVHVRNVRKPGLVRRREKEKELFESL